MFTLTQTSASSLTLLSKLVQTVLSAPDRVPEVFSSPTNGTANSPFEYAQIVTTKPTRMNTCVKTGEGREAFRDLVFVAPALLILLESYSCTKTMNNSHGIILFQKKPGGGGALEALLELPSSGGLRECQHDLLARKTDVLSIARSDFDNPCQWDRGRRGDGRAYAPPVCATPHELRRRCDLS